MSAQRPPVNGPSNSFGRFDEFSMSPGGDRSVQDGLARAVMRAATRQASAHDMDMSIASGMQNVTELLEEMYIKSHRHIVERNEDIARRAALPNISKWNRQLIQGHKNSKNIRSQISKELAVVNALLKRAAPARKSRQSSLKIRPHQPSSANTPHQPLIKNKIPAALLTIGTCTLLLQQFDYIAKHQNAHTQLAQIATASVAIVLLCAHIHGIADANHARRRAQQPSHVSEEK